MTTIEKFEKRICELDEKLADERRMRLRKSESAIRQWEKEREHCFSILKDLASTI